MPYYYWPNGQVQHFQSEHNMPHYSGEWIQSAPPGVNCSNYNCGAYIPEGTPCVRHFQQRGYGCKRCATHPNIQKSWAGPMPDFDAMFVKGGTMEATLIKRGETCIQTILHRTKGGLTVEVHAHRDVEDFMRTFGSGPQVDVSTIGRYWVPGCVSCGRVHPGVALESCANYKPRTLIAYSAMNLGESPQSQQCEDGSYLSLDFLGQPLLKEGDGNGALGVPKTYVNISFLRLAGISEGNGICFGVKGVYSIDRLRKLRDGISIASRKFYIDFLRPVDLSVVVSTQELRL